MTHFLFFRMKDSYYKYSYKLFKVQLETHLLPFKVKVQVSEIHHLVNIGHSVLHIFL